jgi:hypothetical protein
MELIHRLNHSKISSLHAIPATYFSRDREEEARFKKPKRRK